MLIMMKQFEATNEMKSLTVIKLSELTKLSVSKIRIAVRKFKELGYIEDGVLQHNAKTYFLNSKGINKIKELL